MSRRVRRSGLMMPINNARFVALSWTRESDSLDYDLEDSVPQSQKEYARSLVRECLAIGRQGGAQVSVRINTATPEADIGASIWPGLAFISHPKTESAGQVQHIDALISRFERERAVRPGTVDINAMIETAKGVANCYEIASASPRIKAFAGGGGYDMSLDLGVEMFVGFDQFPYGRSECEFAARTLGLEFTVSVFLPDTAGSVSNTDHAYAQAVANRGAGGRGANGLHPNVVAPQVRGYTPPPEEVEEARQILTFFREIDQRGEVEDMLGDRLVDCYEAARARELIDWAAGCAEMDEHKARMRAEALARQAEVAG